MLGRYFVGQHSVAAPSSKHTVFIREWGGHGVPPPYRSNREK